LFVPPYYSYFSIPSITPPLQWQWLPFLPHDPWNRHVDLKDQVEAHLLGRHPLFTSFEGIKVTPGYFLQGVIDSLKCLEQGRQQQSDRL
jgi:hypothetical protein